MDCSEAAPLAGTPVCLQQLPMLIILKYCPNIERERNIGKNTMNHHYYYCYICAYICVHIGCIWLCTWSHIMHSNTHVSGHHITIGAHDGVVLLWTCVHPCAYMCICACVCVYRLTSNGCFFHHSACRQLVRYHYGKYWQLEMRGNVIHRENVTKSDRFSVRRIQYMDKKLLRLFIAQQQAKLKTYGAFFMKMDNFIAQQQARFNRLKW